MNRWIFFSVVTLAISPPLINACSGQSFQITAETQDHRVKFLLDESMLTSSYTEYCSQRLRFPCDDMANYRVEAFIDQAGVGLSFLHDSLYAGTPLTDRYAMDFLCVSGGPALRCNGEDEFGPRSRD